MSEQTELEQWKPPGGDVDAYQAPAPTALTPAQARVDAVSTLLHSAYQKASTLELTPEQDAALAEDFPDEAFKPGAAGKEHLIYIEHAFLRDRFNQVLGRGQWALVRTRPHWAEEFEIVDKFNKTQKCVRIYAEAALLIKGCYVNEAIGEMVYYSNNPSQNYGDAAEGAMTAAFRRCAKNFGVGTQAWKKDFCEGWKQRNGGSKHGPTAPYQPRQTPPVNRQPTQAASTPAPKQATSEKVLGGATVKTREWMLTKLSDLGNDNVRQWAIENKILSPEAALTDWPLTAVPTTGPGIRELMGKIQAWIDDQIPMDDAPPVEPENTEAFWEVQITVPRAGQKKPEYLQAPDTIGSLYKAMKEGDEPSRTRLWGMARGWSPQPWVDASGNTRQPSPNDIKCREALDQFLDWHDQKGIEP